MARPSRNRNQTAHQNENQRPTRNITGPQSALTDFLASHNISARQIRDDADQRRQQAAEQAAENEESPAPAGPGSATRRTSRHSNGAKKSGKKKEEEQKAIEKIKTSKAFKKRKKNADSDDDDDEIARALLDERQPLPGQMENCEICSKRFTVTPYSVAGPNGGLLCTPCGRQMAKERQGPPKKKQPRKQTGGIGSRRAAQSRILDGDYGTKSLATLCVEKLAKNIDLADSLGDLPDHLIDKVARILSKRRLYKPELLPMFSRPTTEVLHVYDGARLSDSDLIEIFQVGQNLRRFKMRNAIQFKDEVMDYLLSRNMSLESFYLHGANLLSEEKWHEFLKVKGETLEGLQVYYTDKHFGDDTIVAIKEHCPNLKRLKIMNNQKVTNKGIKALGELSCLQHLGLQLQNEISAEALAHVLKQAGAGLQTLSLREVHQADDAVLKSMHDNCRSLVKLRLTDSATVTDQGFLELFTNWQNPALEILDLQKCRYVDATKPRDNSDNVGLCGEGFKALMKHSGPNLRNLNVHACRHISQQAFEEAFNENAHYPELTHLEISFCEEVTDFILCSIFRSCPKIREVNVFGCMKVRGAFRMPRGVILVGVPNARGMVTEGTDE